MITFFCSLEDVQGVAVIFDYDQNQQQCMPCLEVYIKPWPVEEEEQDSKRLLVESKLREVVADQLKNLAVEKCFIISNFDNVEKDLSNRKKHNGQKLSLFPGAQVGLSM